MSSTAKMLMLEDMLPMELAYTYMTAKSSY
jgi:hypothetical protein